MSSWPPPAPGNALLELRARPGLNALPMVADATRVAPPRAAPPPRPDTIGPLPPEQQGWFQDLMRRGSRWMQDNQVASIKDFPPMRALIAVMGENPIENIDGPGRAIASFAARNPKIMRYFADPGFENFIMKHGPYTPGHAVTNSPRSLRDNAPEGVIEKLWEQYAARPLTQQMWASRQAADAERRARSVGQALGRRASDPPGNALLEQGQGALPLAGRSNAFAGRARPSIPATEEAFRRSNPHSWHKGWTNETRAKAFDALPDDTHVWVFHATDDKTADAFLRSGARQSEKPVSLGRQRFEAGEQARFQPGSGLGSGLYVGTDPMNVEGYGKRIIAIQVPKSALRVSPEQAALGSRSLGDALSVSDAMLAGDVIPDNIVDVSSAGRFTHAYDALKKVLK